MRHRTIGKLFSLSRLKFVTDNKTDLVTELLLTENTVLLAHTKDLTQRLVDAFAAASNKTGLQINTCKNEVLCKASQNNLKTRRPRDRIK